MVWKKARLGVQFKNAKTFINNALAFFSFTIHVDNLSYIFNNGFRI